METQDPVLTAKLGRIAEAEAKRIEIKYSRYRDDSVTAKINNSRGQPVEVDDETAALLDYADECYELSDGLFDITSGALRRAWRFDGSSNLPSCEEVIAILPCVGWNKITWQRPYITLPANMEIDFGGIGKE
ncbi:MAG TPA: FAD:protein FMN transferase, partial [Pseudomonadales bacterium]|nr:FAD:protein FMN transferase [Pseudomonadales bacterium]